MDTDVIIIGGGISGCALSYFLASDGVEVILLERSGLNSESSGANSGSLHGQIPHETFLDKGKEWANQVISACTANPGGVMSIVQNSTGVKITDVVIA